MLILLSCYDTLNLWQCYFYVFLGEAFFSDVNTLFTDLVTVKNIPTYLNSITKALKQNKGTVYYPCGCYDEDYQVTKS